MTVAPHLAPSSAEMVAATVSVNSAAPGLRMISPASTAGISQTP
jgi:hypothetical protein